jgi:hypothetical protein
MGFLAMEVECAQPKESSRRGEIDGRFEWPEHVRCKPTELR